MRDLIVLGGSSHPELTQEICSRLNINPGKVELTKFQNKETNVSIIESVRGLHVFIVQSACGNVNDMLMELLIMVYACRMASARKITVVLPLFPYNRQPTLKKSFNPGYKEWTAKPGTLVADMLMASGAHHIITLELHHQQYQGFFNVPVDNLMAQPLVCKYIMEKIPNYKEAVVVSPDAGGAKRASFVADALKMKFALIHTKKLTSSSVTLVGSVENRDCIIIDDLVDTCHTVTRAASVLKRYNASKVYAIVTHGIFSECALDRIMRSSIDQVIVSNSVPQQKLCSKVKVYNVAPILAESIRRIHNGESVSFLFDMVPI